MVAFFTTNYEVIRGLITYTDWWQPYTAYLIPVGAARRASTPTDGIRPGLLDTLDERAELCRRMRFVGDRQRLVLFLWYVQQLPVEDIARAVGVSRRHCFRLRASAVRKIVELGDEAA